MDFFSAYALTLIIEGALLFAIFHGRYGTKLIARNAIIASSLTLPFVWFVFPALGLPWAAQTAAAETFAFAVESAIYMQVFPGMGMRDAALSSFACNACSFIIGLAL